MARRPRNYASHVFINCPFDDGYKSMFEAIVFAVFDCGFIPRCALENGDSGTVRIEKIMNIIAVCKYGIHDVSAIQLDSATQLPRFNVPYELGLFIGCKRYGTGYHDEKVCLVLDADGLRYRSFISDFSGQDIRGHGNNPKTAIAHVRHFLAEQTQRKTIPGASTIFDRYTQYLKDKPNSVKILNWDINDLPFKDLQYLINGWLSVNAL
ncbi:MAG TPA: hypothetical protein VK826_12400 [Bacteroidia bacterium]|nr:hypothetical protein [Bacteroidia bacterium]